MDFPDHSFESDTIFSFDSLYQEVTNDPEGDVRKCGFFRARVVNREVPDDEVSLLNLIGDLKLKNELQKIEIPQTNDEQIDPPPGIYHFDTHQCKGRTMKEFRDTLVKS